MLFVLDFLMLYSSLVIPALNGLQISLNPEKNLLCVWSTLVVIHTLETQFMHIYGLCLEFWQFGQGCIRMYLMVMFLI